MRDAYTKGLRFSYLWVECVRVLTVARSRSLSLVSALCFVTVRVCVFVCDVFGAQIAKLVYVPYAATVVAVCILLLFPSFSSVIRIHPNTKTNK